MSVSRFSRLQGWHRAESNGWTSPAVAARFEAGSAGQNYLETLPFGPAIANHPATREFLGLLERMGLDKGEMLDFGCGNAVMRELLEVLQLAQRWSYVGVDVNPLNIESCRRRFPDCRFECVAEGERLPLPAESVDLVVASGVLEFVENTQAQLREFSRVTKDWVALCRLGVRPGEPEAMYWQSVQHDWGTEEHCFRVFNKARLEAMIADADLEVVWTEVSEASGVWLAPDNPEPLQHYSYLLRKRGRGVQSADPSARASIGVVIPTYNMAWCIERAVASCLRQTHPPEEIIVADDCSSDGTGDVVRRLMAKDNRISYHRRPQNGGHLAALRHGLKSSTTDWTALLDADDELIDDSLERRIEASKSYHADSGEWPQLVYGDLYWDWIAPDRLFRFKAILGHDLPFLLRELSLCQTSTIMLGREAVTGFTDSTNPYCTDDEIVLTVAKRFPVVSAGVPVAIVYAHASASKMTNSSRRRFRGVAQLVREHGGDVRREHGLGRYLLWRLRVLRTWLEWQTDAAEKMSQVHSGDGAGKKWRRLLFRLYARLTRGAHWRITGYLQTRFEQIFF